MVFTKGHKYSFKNSKKKMACEICGIIFLFYSSNNKNRKFCSQKCTYISRKNKIPWNKGTKGVMKKNLTSFKKGQQPWNKGKTGMKGYWSGKKRPDMSNKNNCSWMGDGVSYPALHNWIRQHKGNPTKCIKCGKVGEKSNGIWNVHWANIDHKYKRDINDYIGLCASCHQKYDIKNGLYNNKVFTKRHNTI